MNRRDSFAREQERRSADPKEDWTVCRDCGAEIIKGYTLCDECGVKAQQRVRRGRPG